MRTERALGLLGVAITVAYADALDGAFQYDDYNAIVDNPVVHDLASWWADLGHGLRPLLKLSYTLSWLLSSQAWAFVLANILIHAGNTALVYALALEWQRGREPAISPDTTRLGALLAALLFALHPAQTEAVTYVCGRSVSLMTLFYLGGLLAYVRGARIAPAVLFLCALATKEVAATFPLALLLWDATAHTQWRWCSSLRRQWPYWALLLLLGGAALLRSKYAEFFAVSLATRTPWENLVTQAGAIFYLIGQWALPVSLNVDPDLPEPTQLTPAVAVHGALLLAAVGIGLASLRARPLLAFALLWFFLHLAPTNSIFPRIDVANDRQLYLSAIGLFMGLGIAAARHGAVAKIALAAIIVAFTALTALRNLDYRSEVALWEQTATLSPDKARVHNNLGYAYRLDGCAEQARSEFQRALALDPDYALARNNLERIEREQRLGVAGARICK